MPSHIHSDLEELRQKAKIAKKHKKRKSELDEMLSGVDYPHPSSVMLVLHKDEVDLIEGLLCDVLEKDESATKVYPNEKRTALNILKHIQSE